MSNRNLKPLQLKLSKASQTLKKFTNVEIVGNNIVLDDKYQVDNSERSIQLSLIFHNMGIATSTDLFLDQTLVDEKIQGSIINRSLGSDKSIDGCFINIFSTITATNLTPLPANLNVDFNITGGVKNVSFPISLFKLTQPGDIIQIDISIFCFHL